MNGNSVIAPAALTFQESCASFRRPPPTSRGPPPIAPAEHSASSDTHHPDSLITTASMASLDPRMMSVQPRIRYNTIGGVNGPLVILDNVRSYRSSSATRYRLTRLVDRSNFPDSMKSSPLRCLMAPSALDRSLKLEVSWPSPPSYAQQLTQAHR